MEENTGSGPRGYLSFSQVSTYSGCGERYRLQYIEDVQREPSGPGIAGSVIHAVIAESEDELLWKTEDHDELKRRFIRQFCAAVEEAGGENHIRWGGRKSREFPQGEDFRWWLFSGPAMLRRYVTIRQEDLQAGMELHFGGAEMKVSVLVNLEGQKEPTSVMGYIDAFLLVDPNGESMIRDWKTGTWAEPQQLAMYAWMLQHMDPPHNVTRGQLAKLRSPDKAKWLNEYNLTPWIPVIPKLVEGALRGIQHEVYPLNPSAFCSACSVRHACAWGSTLEGP